MFLSKLIDGHEQKEPFYLLINREDKTNHPEHCYLFISTSDDEKCTSRPTKFFVELPNKISTKRDALECAFWFQEIAICHFSTLQLGQFCFGDKLSEFLTSFEARSNRSFFPLSANVFKCYDAVPVEFLAEKLSAKELILWDMPGTDGLLDLCVNGRKPDGLRWVNNRLTQIPTIPIEELWFSFFVPPGIEFDGEETYFDKLIEVRFLSYLKCKFWCISKWNLLFFVPRRLLLLYNFYVLIILTTYFLNASTETSTI